MGLCIILEKERGIIIDPPSHHRKMERFVEPLGTRSEKVSQVLKDIRTDGLKMNYDWERCGLLETEEEEVVAGG